MQVTHSCWGLLGWLIAFSQGAASQGSAVDHTAESPRVRQLRELVRTELGNRAFRGLGVSLVVSPLHGQTAIIDVSGEAPRVPASNAKLLTSAAAATLLPERYQFVTELSVSRNGTLYLWGTGDPLLRRDDLTEMAQKLKSEGVDRIREVVVDDSFFSARRLAPGFESFSADSRYRPTSAALNLDANAVVIRVSPQGGKRRQARVDVAPPSDYVKIRQRVRVSAARNRRAARLRQVRVATQVRGTSLWVDVSGQLGRAARPYVARRAVPDPALNTAWSLRRALLDQGIAVTGSVQRGKRASGLPVLARRERSLEAILTRVNQNSDNLAAETLVRAIGALPGEDGLQEAQSAKSQERASPDQGSWSTGLRRIAAALKDMGIEGFQLKNGSGLHRSSHVTASALVALLRRIHGDDQLRETLLPTMAVAGRAGTLARRMRHTVAEGIVRAKTGTLGGVLALSGYVDPSGDSPLAFSLLVNGSSDHRVRERMDRIAVLLARYAKGLSLAEPVAAR